MPDTNRPAGAGEPRWLGLPRYVWACFAAMLASQLLVYYATRLPFWHLTPRLLALPVDERIPFVPEWVLVYFLAYVSWVVSGLWILSESRAHAWRFVAAFVLAMLISAAVFLICPGTMVRPEVTGSGIFAEWMRLLYRIDTPTNLCPSLHVLVSYFCWRGTLGCRKIPAWYKVFNFVFLVLVCCSILLIKQHVVVDIPVAIVVSELSLHLTSLLRLERVPQAIAAKIQRFGRNS